MKRNTPELPFTVANEYICAELARLVRLPVPPGFVAELPGDGLLAYCCLGFNLHGENSPRIDPAEAFAAEPDLCCGVLAFDIWVANTDRHRRNISFQADRVPHRLNMFDHSHAPVFYLDLIAENRDLLGVDGSLGNRHCLLDVVDTDEYLWKWVELIQAVPAVHVRNIVADAVELGLPRELSYPVGDFLLYRQAHLGRLIALNREAFPSIHQWGVTWEHY